MFCEIDLKNGMKMGFRVAELDGDEAPRKTVYIAMSKTETARDLGTTWGIKLKKAEYLVPELVPNRDGVDHADASYTVTTSIPIFDC